MRIRTIKPDYWVHPIMARLEPRTQLLGLALLNHADDHGYFMADPAIIRGACAPFREDLATIREDLARLVEVGWIDMGRHPEHGAIGWICKWSEHQRVDHPKESKIQPKCSTGRFERGAKKSRENFAKPREVVALDQGSGIRDQGREQGAENPARADGGQDPFDGSLPAKRAISDSDHWQMHERSQPWARELKSAGCKIGPDNWTAWQSLVALHSLAVVVSCAAGVPADVRWPDQTEKALTASRGQENPGNVVARKTVKLTL